MMYYNDNDYRDYLAHHGILGQRWGKRNGPPYPLGAEDHSASEKKAGWRKSLDSVDHKGKENLDKENNKIAKKQEKAYNKLAETENKKGAAGVYEYITSNIDRDYIRFQDKSKNAKTLRNTLHDYKADSDQFNYDINRRTSKALGAKSYQDYMSKHGGGSNIVALTTYYAKGLDIRNEYLKTDQGKAYTRKQEERINTINQAAKAYEKEARDFVRSKLGKFADKECTSEMAIKYDPKTNNISKQTMEDMVSIEMLRRAGGGRVWN